MSFEGIAYKFILQQTLANLVICDQFDRLVPVI